MQVTLLTTLNELEQVAHEWSELWTRSPASPFQTPEWLLNWQRLFGSGTPCTLAARREGRLVGLLPLELCNGHLFAIGRGVTDYVDAIVDPSEIAHVRERLVREVTRLTERHELVLSDLPAHSLLVDIAPSAVACSETVCPVLRLPTSQDQFRAQLPRWMLRNVRQGQARAQRLGPVWIGAADLGSVDEFMSKLFELHAAEWSQRGLPGVLSDPTVQSFHRAAARGLLSRGVARLFGLGISGELRAVLYVLQDRARAYQYIGGMDPELSRLNLGSLLIDHAIADAIASGKTEYDFLRGAERYKYVWGAEDRPLFTLRLGARHAVAS